MRFRDLCLYVNPAAFGESIDIPLGRARKSYLVQQRRMQQVRHGSDLSDGLIRELQPRKQSPARPACPYRSPAVAPQLFSALPRSGPWCHASRALIFASPRPALLADGGLVSATRRYVPQLTSPVLNRHATTSNAWRSTYILHRAVGGETKNPFLLVSGLCLIQRKEAAHNCTFHELDFFVQKLRSSQGGAHT